MRHGQIQGYETKRFIGQTDVLLDKQGKNQAKTWHNALANIEFNAIYSSSLQRCSHTAQLVCPKQKINFDPRLNEINMGKWDGKTFDEIKKKRAEEFKKRGNDIYEFRPPDGESFKDLSDRLLSFLNKLQTKCFKQNNRRSQKRQYSNTLLVSHAGVIRVLICHILGMKPQDLFNIKLDYGHLFVLKH